jgi:hypothetical protein
MAFGATINSGKGREQQPDKGVLRQGDCQRHCPSPQLYDASIVLFARLRPSAPPVWHFSSGSPVPPRHSGVGLVIFAHQPFEYLRNPQWMQAWQNMPL